VIEPGLGVAACANLGMAVGSAKEMAHDGA